MEREQNKKSRIIQMDDPSIQQIIDAMPSRFNPEATNGADLVLQFRLSGEQARTFYADISGQHCAVRDGEHTEPTLTLKMSDTTYVDMVMGRLTGQQAFFTRKLRYEGPIALAIRLHKFFTAVQPVEGSP